MWESMNETGVYKCPYSMRPEVYTRETYIRCAGKEDHKMYSGEADNVIEMFCDGNFKECNYYKKYEEEKTMEQNLLPQEEFQSMVETEVSTAMSEGFKKAFTVHLTIKQIGEIASKAFS